jgi:hypothetical protein
LVGYDGVDSRLLFCLVMHVMQALQALHLQLEQHCNVRQLILRCCQLSAASWLYDAMSITPCLSTSGWLCLLIVQAGH